MIEYVCGFMFKDTRVLLIRKNRPKWQEGKLNGVGGHIENGETIHEAMSREFREETSIETRPQDWYVVARLLGADWCVYFLAMYGDIEAYCDLTDEPLYILEVSAIATDERIIPNLKWLVPMALNRINNPHTTTLYKIDNQGN